MTLDWQYQWSLRRPIHLQGHGLHSGRPVELSILPAKADEGITFVRTDLPNAPRIPALTEFVCDTTLSTTLGHEGARIQTVEHLLAALSGLGVSNAQVLVSGPELPAMDGSSLPYVRAISRAGVVPQKAFRKVVSLEERLELTIGDRSLIYLPAETARITYVVDFGHPMAGPQLFEQELTPEVFQAQVADARTFCLEREYQRMRKMGLARGGTPENGVLIRDDGYSSMLRHPDEFVRHKVLDLIGDLALIGGGSSWAGHVIAVKAGHATHVRFASLLRERALAQIEARIEEETAYACPA